MKNSNQLNLTTSAGWSTVLNGSTEVYNDPATLIPAQIGWVPFNIQHFSYSGGGLEIITDWDNSMASTPQATGIIQWRYTSGLPGIRTIGKPGSAPETTLFSLYGGTLRPNIRITFYASGTPQTDAGVAQIVNPTGGVTAGMATGVIVKIKNFGSDTISSASIHWSIDGIVQAPFSFTGALLKDSFSVPINIGSMTLLAGLHTLKIWTANPNGQSDLNLANDTITSTIMACPGQLAGTYTIGGSNPDFSTFNDALVALQQCGVSAAVTFQVASGTYNGQITVLPVPGASAVNTITFTSSANDSTAVTLAHQASKPSDNFILKLDGAQYIQFIKIRFAPGDPIHATAIQVVNGAKYNKIAGCYLVGKTGSSDSQILICSENPGNTGNLFEGNRFENGSAAISLKGLSLSSLQSGSIIRRNVLQGFYASGIKADYVEGLIIDSNVIISALANPGLKTGIDLNHFQGNTRVTRNTINLTGSDQTLGIYLLNGMVQTGQYGLIANNFITIPNGIAETSGIKVNASAAQKVLFNSLRIQGTTPIATSGIYTTASSSDIVVLNNNIESNFYPTLYEGASCSRSDYNNLQSLSGMWGYITTSHLSFTSLNAYRISAQKDTNSVAIAAGFLSGTDLHTTQLGLKGAAFSVPEVTIDIDGALRNMVAPTIGADELPDFANDLFTMQLLQPAGGCNLGAADTVRIRVANAGTQMIPSGFTLNYQVIGSPVVASETVNQPLPAGNTMDYAFRNTINLTLGSLQKDSIFGIKIWSTYPADQFHQNDSLIKNIVSGYQPAAPQVMPQTTPYGSALTLTATSTDTLAWYLSDTASSPLYTGKYFTTPLLYANKTYWVSAVSLQGLHCESVRVPLTVTLTGIPAIDAGISAILNPPGDIPANAPHQLLVRLKNFGGQPLQSAGITYSLNGVLKDTVQWAGTLAQGAETDVILDTLMLTSGSYTLKTWSILPNGITDPFLSNDTASLNFIACMSGTYTLGPVGGTTTYDFNTFTNAVNVLQTAGVCGNVTILVADGIYNEQLTIYPIPGAGPDARITFTSMSGDSTSVTLKQTLSSTIQWAVKLNGADYITFSHMTISVLGSTTYGRALHLENGADYNSVENCIIEGVSIANTGYNYANIFVLGGMNQYNIIQNNKFLNGGQSLYFAGGNASGRSKGNIISGNIFQNYHYLGVMTSYHDSVQIVENQFFSSNINNNAYGILTSYCINQSRILKNRFQGGNPGYFYGIHVSNWTSTATDRALIANNFVSITAGTGSSYGIYLYNCAYSEVYHNTVNEQGTGILARAAFIYQVTALNFRNNILKANLGYAVYFTGNSTIEACDYNNLSSNGAYIANITSIDYATFNAYKAAATWDQHSWSMQPLFASNTDLHLQNTQLSGKGQFIAKVPDDIDGEIREQIPTIGADEVALPAVDAAVTQVNNPGVTTQEFDVVNPQVVICNQGADTLFIVPVAYQVNGSNPVYFNYVGVLPPYQCDTVTLPSFVSPAGMSTFCAFTQVIGDSSTFNDTLCKNFFGNTAFDAAVVKMDPIQGGCGLTTDSVKILIRNDGGLSISGNLMAFYRAAAGATVLSQPVPSTILPGDSLWFTFSTPVSLAVSGADSLFKIRAWVNLPLDNVKYNDTTGVEVKSLFTPAAPVVVHATIPYGSPASVSATSSTGSILRWYDAPTGGNMLHEGGNYTTTGLYSNDTLWVEAAGGFQGATVIAGTGTGLNGPTTWPTPYGNQFWGNKEQYLITAAELTALGATDAPISAIGFQVAATNACPALTNYTIRMMHTTASAITVWVPGTFSTVYSVPAYQPVQGWNQHIFQAPFVWDGIQNIVVEVCFNNTSFTSSGNASVYHTTTIANTVVRYGGNNPVVCSAPAYPYVIADRPNMQLKFEATGCTSSRVPLYIAVTGQPSADVGVTAFIRPVTGPGLGSLDTVEVTLKNFGTALQSNIPVSFRVDNLPVITETVPLTIPAGASVNYQFTAKANLSIPGKFYQITAYTGLTGDAFHLNDTTTAILQHLLPDPCPSGATSPANEEITQVVLHTLNSVSSATGAMYTNYTSSVQPPQLKPGTSYPFSVKSSFTTGYVTQQACIVKAWIDLNQDTAFDINNEEVFVSITKSDSTVNGSILIPFNATPGNARMRIVLNQTSNAAAVVPCGNYNYGETEDYMVTITPPPVCDAGLLSVIKPTTPSFAGAPVPVLVKFANFGQDTIHPNTLSISMTLNNGTPIITSYTGTLPSVGIDSINLPSIVLNPGNNSLCISLSLPCDTISLNDEICMSVFGQIYAGLSFLDDFESGNVWYSPSTNLNWQYGTPSANVITSAYSGTKAWVTNLTGDYSNNANEWLYSPCFDFSQPGLTDTVTLSFYHWLDMAYDDFGNVEYTLNNGAGWVNLGFSGDILGINWYNTQQGGLHFFSLPNTGWQYSAYKLPPSIFNGQDSVQFRFHFSSNSSVTANGWAIDNFALSLPQQPIDAGITAINYPVNDTATGTLIYAEVTLMNYGTNALSTIPLELRIDGVVAVQETWTGSLASQGTATYTFSNAYIVPGSPFQLCAASVLPGDPVINNDATCRNFGTLPAMNDVGISQIVEPAAGNICAYHPVNLPWYQFPVTVRIANYGQNSQSSIPVDYMFYNGGQIYTDTWTGSLAPGAYTDYTLLTLFKPNLGTQQLCVETQLAGDAVSTNNELCQSYTGTYCTGTDDLEGSGLILYQNIPNPADETTIIPFEVPSAGIVKITLFNLQGQTLAYREWDAVAGLNSAQLDVSELAAGIYQYSIEFGGTRLFNKLMVCR
ncbi:MAG TPA: GEVED domain-containing protein [Bacteroidales bacterium]|nr:GEVED domain-containing protein [Bacteroidales bacterium]